MNTNTKELNMKELDMNELEQANGGWGFIIAAVACGVIYYGTMITLAYLND